MSLDWRGMVGIALLSVASLGACNEASEPPVLPDGASGQLPEGHPALDGAAAPTVGMSGPVGTVLETMDAGGYTYARLDIAGEEMWAAGPPSDLAVDDEVALVNAMGMQDFTSNTLNRTFDQILFVAGFETPGAGPETFSGNRGLVKETMDAAGYTYVQVEIEGETMWLAGPVTAVEAGQTVGWMGGALMQGFTSSTLERTFDAILFVDRLAILD